MCAPEGLQGPGKCQNCTSITPLARERGGTQKGAPSPPPPRGFSIFPEPRGQDFPLLISWTPFFLLKPLVVRRSDVLQKYKRNTLTQRCYIHWEWDQKA